MHALASARLSDLYMYPRPFDIPFGIQTVVETGYEWEQYVFGGLITTKRPDILQNKC
jgi:hypothetical protein